jgi:hypothetical protein
MRRWIVLVHFDSLLISSVPICWVSVFSSRRRCPLASYARSSVSLSDMCPAPRPSSRRRWALLQGDSDCHGPRAEEATRQMQEEGKGRISSPSRSSATADLAVQSQAGEEG